MEWGRDTRTDREPDQQLCSEKVYIYLNATTITKSRDKMQDYNVCCDKMVQGGAESAEEERVDMM